MATTTFLVLLFLLKTVSAQDPTNFTVAYICRTLVNGDWQMDLSIETHGNPVDKIQGIDVLTQSEQGMSCDNTPDVPTINPIQEIRSEGTLFKLVIDVDSATGVGTPNCGYAKTPDDGLAAGQFKWRFRIHTDHISSEIRFAYEKDYNLFCDFNNADGTVHEFIGGGVNITDEPPPEVTTIVDEAKLSVVMNDTLSPVTVINTGTVTRLKAELVTEGVEPQTPPRTGISPYSCKVCSNVACSADVIELTDTNGCLTSSGTALLGERFTNTISMDANGAYLYTGAFEFFAFSNSLNADVSDVIFTCSFDYCDSNTGPSRCIDRCAATTGRKKRDTIIHHNYIMKIAVKAVANNFRRSSNPVQGEFQKELPEDKNRKTLSQSNVGNGECVGYLGFLVGVSVLGVFLVVAVIVSICLFTTLSKRQKLNKDKLDGFKNPAFN